MSPTLHTSSFNAPTTSASSTNHPPDSEDLVSDERTTSTLPLREVLIVELIRDTEDLRITVKYLRRLYAFSEVLGPGVGEGQLMPGWVC